MSLRPAAKALDTWPTEPETPANQHAEPPPDLIADLRDWTEDDTQSHDWISSGVSLSRSEASAPETEVSAGLSHGFTQGSEVVTLCV